MLRVCFLAFTVMINANAASHRVTVLPVSQLAVVGSQISFNCSTFNLSKLRWDFYKPGNPTDPVIIYDGLGMNHEHAATSRYVVNKSTINGEQRSELIITDVQLTDAGLFSCSLSIDETDRADANLTVLEEPMKCFGLPSSSVKERETFQIGCNLTYRGNTGPTIDCDANGQKYTLQHPNYTASVTANAKLHGTSFNCQVVQTANLSTSFSMNVTYGPSTVSIDSKHNAMNSFRCSAVSNPPPSYKWTDLSTGKDIAWDPDIDPCLVFGRKSGELQVNLSCTATSGKGQGKTETLWTNLQCDDLTYTGLAIALLAVALLLIVGSLGFAIWHVNKNGRVCQRRSKPDIVPESIHDVIYEFESPYSDVVELNLIEADVAFSQTNVNVESVKETSIDEHKSNTDDVCVSEEPMYADLAASAAAATGRRARSSAACVASQSAVYADIDHTVAQLHAGEFALSYKPTCVD